MPYITEVPVKKSILIVLLSALLTLPACAPAGEAGARLTVVCTTYPIYLFARGAPAVSTTTPCLWRT